MINKKIYGLTGMSGAGKSTVCDSFENAGFLIIDCDRLAREVVRKGRPCLDKLHRLFGDSVITKDGELDRRARAISFFRTAINSPCSTIRYILT